MNLWNEEVAMETVIVILRTDVNKQNLEMKAHI